MKRNLSKNREYGHSPYYTADSGEDYFNRQMRNAELGAKLNTVKFRPWVGPDDRVLDFGCSGGWLLKELAPAVKVGVELNTLHHPYCEQNGVLVFQDLAEISEHRFSKIISHHCLEHVPYPIRALEGMRDLMEESGRLIIVVPIDDWRRQRNIHSADKDHHLHTWTPVLMRNTLKEAGFELLHAKVLTHAWPKKWQLLYRRLPLSVFNLICVGWSVFSKRRQLHVVARLK